MAKKKGFFGEFREFIARGNVVDMAVGIIVGSAFTKIVNSLVNDIINPFVGWLIGNKNFADLSVVLVPDDVLPRLLRLLLSSTVCLFRT